MSLHTDALAVLRGWGAPDDEQRRLRDTFVDHLETTADGMWRSSYPDHLTAGTLVVSAGGDEVLLNLHRKAGRWFHFGGHAEAPDPTLRSVAAREAAEESGLDDLVLHPEPLQLDVHVVPFCDTRGGVRHLDVRYGALAVDRDRAAASDESLAVRWWPVAALPELEPRMHRLIELTRRTLC